MGKCKKIAMQFQLEIRSVETGYRPNPWWLPGGMWNCSVCITSSYGVVILLWNLQKSNLKERTHKSSRWPPPTAAILDPKSNMAASTGYRSTHTVSIRWSSVGTLCRHFHCVTGVLYIRHGKSKMAAENRKLISDLYRTNSTSHLGFWA
jgi:hypothetical protein